MSDFWAIHGNLSAFWRLCKQNDKYVLKHIYISYLAGSALNYVNRKDKHRYF
jgi:hypothetical protein